MTLRSGCGGRFSRDVCRARDRDGSQLHDVRRPVWDPVLWILVVLSKACEVLERVIPGFGCVLFDRPMVFVRVLFACRQYDKQGLLEHRVVFDQVGCRLS